MPRDTSGPKAIGLQIPKIVLKAARGDPKRLKRIREIYSRKKQLKFPGMKKGKSITIKPVGMVFKVEKKLAGGLLGTGIKAAIRSEPYKKTIKKLIDKKRKSYNEEIKRRVKRGSTMTSKELKEFKALEKLDIQGAKSKKIFDMTQFVLNEARKYGRKDITKTMRKSRRKIVDYGRSINEKIKAMFEKKAKNVKLNSKGGMQKFNTGGMADYYKDIL